MVGVYKECLEKMRLEQKNWESILQGEASLEQSQCWILSFHLPDDSQHRVSRRACRRSWQGELLHAARTRHRSAKNSRATTGGNR